MRRVPSVDGDEEDGGDAGQDGWGMVGWRTGIMRGGGTTVGGVIVLRKMIIMRGRSEIAIMSETNEERGIEIIATGETGMIGRRGMTDAIGTVTIVEGEMD